METGTTTATVGSFVLIVVRATIRSTISRIDVRPLGDQRMLAEEFEMTVGAHAARAGHPRPRRQGNHRPGDGGRQSCAEKRHDQMQENIGKSEHIIGVCSSRTCVIVIPNRWNVNFLQIMPLQLNFNLPVEAAQNATGRTLSLPVFLCPSDTAKPTWQVSMGPPSCRKL